MYWIVRVGPAAPTETWEQLANAHAANIGSEFIEHKDVLLETNERASIVGFHFQRETLPQLTIDPETIQIRIASGLPVPAGADATLIADDDAAWSLSICRRSGTMQSEIQATDPGQCYYFQDERGRVVSNDQRLIIGWAGLDLDDLGIFGLFTFAFLPPTRTLSKNVRRLPPGARLHWPSTASAPAVSLPAPLIPAAIPLEMQAEQLLERIDRTMNAPCDRAAVFFSGGVDSSLLAARLRNRCDSSVPLINMSFGEGDVEAEQARDVAAHLKMPFEQFVFQPQDVMLVLDRIGRDYPYPFSDLSTPPANLLAHETAKYLSHAGYTIIDGAGADATFGMERLFSIYRKLNLLPQWIKYPFAAAYRKLGWWEKSISSRPAILGMLVYKLSQYPLVLAMAARSTLDGVAFHCGRDSRQAMGNDIAALVNAYCRELPLSLHFSVLDLLHICGDRVAAKTFAPLRARGIFPVFPFMHPSVIEAALALPPSARFAGGDSKALLKKMLSESLPRELVYRRKSGFLPPVDAIFSLPDFQAFAYDEILSPGNSITDRADRKVLRNMMDKIVGGAKLSLNCYNLLWCLAFLTRWRKSIVEP